MLHFKKTSLSSRSKVTLRPRPDNYKAKATNFGLKTKAAAKD